jgi:MFS family permease
VPVPWRHLRLPLVVALFGGFTFYVMLIETSYLLVENGVGAADTATIGAVAAAASLVTAAGAFSFPRLVRRGHRFVLPLAFGLQALGMILIWVVGGVPGVVAGAIIAGFGSGVLLPSMLTWALSGIRFEERGRATGWWNAAFFFGQFLTPLLIGGLVAALGALPTAVGIVGIACALVALALGLRLRRTTSAPTPAPSEEPVVVAS